MKSNFSTATKSQFKSKLEVNELFVKCPMNLKCVLSQNERDFLEAVIHLQSLEKYNTSDVLIMANSGLNSNQITLAKKNLIKLGLLEVVTNKSQLGSRYVVKAETYNRLLRQLNDISNAPQRFETGDKFREEHDLQPIFVNIINTLNRRLKTGCVPDEERITAKVEQKHQPTYEEQKAILKQQLEDGEITNEQYYKIIKRLNIN
jgi:hypothetical protein